MDETPFEARVDVLSQIAVMRMVGFIMRPAADDLDAAFRSACATGLTTVALDFDDVEYLNSTGIALIVGVLRQAREAGLIMLAWGLSDHFREIFEITRIVEFMTLYDNESTALAEA